MNISGKYIDKQVKRCTVPRVCLYCNGLIGANCDYVVCTDTFGTRKFEWSVHKNCDMIATRLAGYAGLLNGEDISEEYYRLLDGFVEQSVCDECPDRRDMQGERVCRGSVACIHRAVEKLS